MGVKGQRLPIARGLMADQPSDNELVQQALAGDRRAFGTLVGRHVRGVYAVARSFTQNHADADDLAQEAFLHAYRGLRTFRGRAAFRTWLLRIAVNVCTNFVNRSRPTSRPAGGLDGLSGPAADPADIVSKDEVHRLLQDRIAGLPVDLRATLTLVVGQGLSHQDAAEILGCARNTVSWRMFRARELLREQLGPLLDEEQVDRR